MDGDDAVAGGGDIDERPREQRPARGVRPHAHHQRPPLPLMMLLGYYLHLSTAANTARHDSQGKPTMAASFLASSAVGCLLLATVASSLSLLGAVVVSFSL